jgi:FkbM family methyltransferase
MSRKVAAFLYSTVTALNALQPKQQQAKSLAELLLKLEAQLAITLDTPRGPLKFHGARGRHAYLMAASFMTSEPETIAWIERYVQPGETLWDIGAAVGAYALYAAKGGAKVIAFEPKATSYGLFTEHIGLNGLDGAVAGLNLALSDATGLTRLELQEMAAGGAMNAVAGAATQFGETPAGFSQGVVAITMDDARRLLGLPQPDHVKLDVDGIEGRILAGGAETLRAVKSVIVEVEGANAADADARISAPLAAAGLREDVSWRDMGSKRNRLFLR